MGTRCLTVIVNEWENEEVVVLYRQFDGYPSVHGLELAEFLHNITMTDGLQGKNTANGIACLSAQIIAHFKDAPGQFYLYPAGKRDIGEEYIYTVSMPDRKLKGLHVSVDSTYSDDPTPMYAGDVGGFVQFCHGDDDE